MAPLDAAQITIANNDPAGIGFNDPTPVAPVGGNSGTTKGQQRLNVFQQAANSWGAVVASTVPIIVQAQFAALTCSVTSARLGQAGPTFIVRNFANAPLPSTWYPIALANALAGTDLANSQPAISATFSLSIDQGCLSGVSGFYYGLDDAPASGTLDLLPVVQHELAHGLGFTTFTNGATGAFAQGTPSVYDYFVYDNAAGKTWAEMGSDGERAASALRDGQLAWSGPQATAAAATRQRAGLDGGGRILLYAPSALAPGSSIVHWDRRANPALLMGPFLSAGLSGLDLTANQLADIGWSIAAPLATILPQSGWWWNPAEGGRGFSLELSGSNVFMSTYLYAADGSPLWYVALAPRQAAVSFQGSLQQYANGQTLTGAYQAPALLGTIGSATLSLDSAGSGRLVWPGGTTPIQRFDFVTGGAASGPAAGMPQTGWWWNPAEGGRGFFIEVQNTTMLISGYMYDSRGQAVWYTSQGPMTSPTLYQGPLQQYQGGQTLTGAYAAPNLAESLGTVSLQFSSQSQATLTLPNGTQIPLTRYVF